MYPSPRDEDCLPSGEFHPDASVDAVAEEAGLVVSLMLLLGVQNPLLIQTEILVGGRDHPEHLLTLEHVVPESEKRQRKKSEVEKKPGLWQPCLSLSGRSSPG